MYNYCKTALSLFVFNKTSEGSMKMAITLKYLGENS